MITKDKRSGPKPETLCNYCARACGDCSWSRDFIPVKGWDATETRIMFYDCVPVESYNVRGCPLFCADKKRHTERIREDRLTTLVYKIIERAIIDYAKILTEPDKTDRRIKDGWCKSKSAVNQETIEQFFNDPNTDDMLHVCGIKITGSHILNMIRSDPHGVLDRIHKIYRSENKFEQPPEN